MGPTGAPDHLTALPALLRDWLPARRWFAEKGRPLQAVRVAERAELPAPGPLRGLEVLVLAADFADGPSRYYQLHLARRAGSDDASPAAVIGTVHGEVLYDGLHDPAVTGWLLAAIRDGRRAGGLDFVPEPGATLPVTETGRVVDAEQSNTSVRWGERSILKIYRRLSAGVNPDLELHRALRAAGSTSVAALQGAVEGTLGGEPATYGLLQEFAAGSQDGWERATAAVRGGHPFTADARALGEALADVHVALRDELGTTEADPAAMAGYWTSRLEHVAGQVPVLAPHVPAIRAVYDEVAALGRPVTVQRVHGDLHLGQTLRTPESGWLLIDFEGEPAATARERRAPDAAVRDVVGMLFSFEYAAFHHLLQQQGELGGAGSVAGRDTPGGDLGSDTDAGRSAHAWSASNRDAFCAGYAARAGADPREQAALLRAYEIDKAVYQVLYETRSRPTWLPIPLTAIARTTFRPST
ncbi:maltokinase N-terminal cap-like domain-containing protein [Pseudonocardia nantongensis]|uniref:maltokinase N-terminal cap-like domain-containing protein n=1 Tax=Pseudonocardia nantongensis TaxID=1181885 RepID=UPI003979290A